MLLKPWPNANSEAVVDGVNSSGGIIIPKLLEQMGVSCVKLYCEPNGQFPHNAPEPLKEHLGDICKLVVEENNCIYGNCRTDPDVDRLAFIYAVTAKVFGRRITFSSLCRLCTE